MKLQNKKTGKIGYSYFHHCKDKICTIVDENARKIDDYTSLAELNAEWEDYEEPKPWWYIDITLVVKQGELFLSKHVEQFKTVGNYFETREEAEKAVDKLKAWKRLKDKGFRFMGWNRRYCDEINYQLDTTEDMNNDLDLLFGGEE